MRRVAVVVEGATERAFLDQVLQPHLGDAVALQAMVVHTSRAADGSARRGGGAWKHYQQLLLRLTHQPHWDLVTTMIDFYGFPGDGPRCCSGSHQQPACVDTVSDQMARSIASQRFHPFVALHEFETLVLAAAAASGAPLGDAKAGRALQSIIDDHRGDAERVDHGPATAPSKRLAKHLGGYRKVRDGIAILQETDLGTVLDACPRFATWVLRLRAG